MITYNQQACIKQAMESVLAQQTDFAMELNIFNDASTDNTDEVIREVISSHPGGNRVNYYLHEKNIGLSSNYIYSIKNCHGKYVAICEGDDYWTDKTKLQKQVDFMEQNPEYSLCFHEGLIVNTATNEYTVYPVLKETRFDVSTFFDIVTIPMASVVFRNNSNIHFLPGHLQMDFNLLCTLLMQGPAFFIREIMSVYRVHENAATFHHFTAGYLKARITHLGIEAKYPSFSLPVRKEIAHMYLTHLLILVTHFRKEVTTGEIVGYLRKSIQLQKKPRSYYSEYKQVVTSLSPALGRISSYFNLKRMMHFFKKVYDKLTVRGFRDQLLYEIKTSQKEVGFLKEQLFINNPVMVIGGMKMYLPLFYTDHIQKIIYQTRNFYELETLEFLRLHYKQFDHIIDIGSNVGNHMLYYCGNLKPQKVRCFEPNSFIREQLLQNIALNHLDKLVTVHSCALGAANGNGTQTGFTLNNTGMNRIDLVTEQEDAANAVEIRSLDDLQIEHANFIKIDVEGFEAEVLQGAEQTIKRTKPVIMVEVFDNNRQQVEALLQSFGYRKFFTLEEYNDIYVPE
jgi:FkbM family methyltransferase